MDIKSFISDHLDDFVKVVQAARSEMDALYRSAAHEGKAVNDHFEDLADRIRAGESIPDLATRIEAASTLIADHRISHLLDLESFFEGLD